MHKPPDNAPEALLDYLRMWNEQNPNNIRSHLDKAVAENCIWVDPQHNHIGRDALEANVKSFREKFTDAELILASNIDSHNLRYRYEWAIMMNGDLLITGFDVSTLNTDGLIERVDGFFGRLTPIALSSAERPAKY